MLEATLHQYPRLQRPSTTTLRLGRSRTKYASASPRRTPRSIDPVTHHTPAPYPGELTDDFRHATARPKGAQPLRPGQLVIDLSQPLTAELYGQLYSHEA